MLSLFLFNLVAIWIGFHILMWLLGVYDNPDKKEDKI